ncbi:unnamed protein product [Caenorhabditis auriculariae]|uniref:Uncharacterized protein n=1 Tax=Caenorhabditis auriculariae TaxID=2777116 RepID=A0A8S1H1V1_9PELO|nr:unnamed protein product [Caenorhabditis auriculariae]
MLRCTIILLSFLQLSSSLTCYNGMKTLSMQQVGETTEECPPSAYCYNMTASAYVLVNFVKAGCSTWRCMLAANTCIHTTFQLIPVSLCCCSHDRCNVGGNPVFSDNPRQITDGRSDSNNNGGNAGGSWGDAGGNANNNGWGNNEDTQKKDKYGSDYAINDFNPKTKASSKAPKFSQKDVEKTFRDFSIDNKADEIELEGEFKKIDATYAPGYGSSKISGKSSSSSSSSSFPSSSSSGTLTMSKEMKQRPLNSGDSKSSGKEIEI